MKYFTFYRENNDFKDIENDTVLKKYYSIKLRWAKHLYIGIDDTGEMISYLMLKYSEDILRELCPDRTPVEGRDYTASRKPQNS